MDSWFREIPVPRTWRVYLAVGFDFHKKNRACFGSIGVPKPRLHEQFLCDNFYVTIFICLCRREKLANFYVTTTFAEKLAC